MERKKEREEKRSKIVLRSGIADEAGFVLVADQALCVTQEICDSCYALINERLRIYMTEKKRMHQDHLRRREITNINNKGTKLRRKENLDGVGRGARVDGARSCEDCFW